MLTKQFPWCAEWNDELRALFREYVAAKQRQDAIHCAKGQQWKSVRILNVVDGCIPSDMATGTAEEIEEERRLLHVAMTRAQDELDLIVPQRFFTHNQAKWGDRHLYACGHRVDLSECRLDR